MSHFYVTISDNNKKLLLEVKQKYWQYWLNYRDASLLPMQVKQVCVIHYWAWAGSLGWLMDFLGIFLLFHNFNFNLTNLFCLFVCFLRLGTSYEHLVLFSFSLSLSYLLSLLVIIFFCIIIHELAFHSQKKKRFRKCIYTIRLGRCPLLFRLFVCLFMNELCKSTSWVTLLIFLRIFRSTSQCDVNRSNRRGISSEKIYTFI